MQFCRGLQKGDETAPAILKVSFVSANSNAPILFSIIPGIDLHYIIDGFSMLNSLVKDFQK